MLNGDAQKENGHLSSESDEDEVEIVGEVKGTGEGAEVSKVRSYIFKHYMG